MKFQEIVDEIIKDKEELEKLEQEYTNKQELFRAKMKEKLGLSPGDTADILDMAFAVRKIMEYEK